MVEGSRMQIETDRVKLLLEFVMVKQQIAPITLNVTNKDHQKWLDIMAVEDIEEKLKSNVASNTHVRDMPIWSVG